VCSSLIEIASAALGCDLRAQGRTIERLGRDNIRAILDDAERGAEPCPAGTH
jgi:opine dehydrogenase